MVKNTSGGRKSKQIARKTTLFTAKEPTRTASNEYEEYAIVTKMYGNGRCQVKTHTGLDLQCIIRNKFRGRSKRGNVVSVGSYILIGLREWEKMSGYKNCDLLEIFDEDDVYILQNNPLFKKIIAEASKDTVHDGLFSFSKEECDDTLEGGSALSKLAHRGEMFKDVGEEKEEFNFDDI